MDILDGIQWTLTGWSSRWVNVINVLCISGWCFGTMDWIMTFQFSWDSWIIYSVLMDFNGFFHILGIMIPTDELIFFKMVRTTNQTMFWAVCALSDRSFTFTGGSWVTDQATYQSSGTDHFLLETIWVYLPRLPPKSHSSNIGISLCYVPSRVI